MVVARSIDKTLFLYTPHVTFVLPGEACGVHGKRGKHGFFRNMTEKLR
jgi:hypothetical protein